MAAGLCDLVRVALELFNSFCPGAFPLVRRIHLVPGFHLLILGVAHLIARVCCLHVEIGSGNQATGGFRRFYPVALNLHGAGAEGAFRVRQEYKVVVLAGSVHRADGRGEVVHVRLHMAVFKVRLFRAFAAFEGFAAIIHAHRIAFPPFLKGAPEVFRRNNMFPFNLAGAALVAGSRETFRQADVAAFIIRGGTIDGDPVIEIDLLGKHALGLAEGIVAFIAFCKRLARLQRDACNYC